MSIIEERGEERTQGKMKGEKREIKKRRGEEKGGVRKGGEGQERREE